MNRRHLLQTLAATSAVLSGAGCATGSSIPDGLAEGRQSAWRLDGAAGFARLWLWLPPGYAQRREPWPLLVFLHGSGERGEDLQRVKVYGPPRLADEGGAQLPCILASPQLEEGARWAPARLHALLEALKSRLRVDPDRVSATGLSLGGHGVWDWACAHPQDLAAIAPVCGYGNPRAVAAMREVPVRAYHGDRDTVVPLARQQACVDALRAAGGQATLTVFPGVGHDAWTPAYQDPQLLPWLLAQVRR
ncbi:dienelactone hydrolase family protein [Pelomonas sp. CA6]|uniref:carboxylesterase family protein n=1 Tax=Pelomonas sp. CA6 TaxID=2907999 RepID=UPI001F4A8852|nr:dienelactone hydrolase family protein [Pelomonas sp. CA6]MCH7342880.1 dienelactone hydrolase family protein [Pelomonas sp. CA6]